MTFRRVRLLGNGYFGQVWLEEDSSLGRQCAAKYVTFVPGGADPFAEARQMLAAKHDHVVEVYSADMEHGVPVIRMAYHPRGSVTDAYGHGPLPVALATAVIGDACRGVECLHSRGLLHRDLKPANLLVRSDGRRCVSDFGLACSQRDVQTSACVGYGPHLPPESFEEGRITTAAGDVYALGVTLHRLLLGDAAAYAPLEGLTDISSAIRRGAFPDRRGYPLHVHGGLRRVVNKALHLDVAKRHQSARDLRHAVESVQPVVSWGPERGGQEWTGEALDGSAHWRARIEADKAGFAFRAERRLAGKQFRAVTAYNVDAVTRQQIEVAAAQRLEAIATGK